ncbi:MAG: MFS transporter [Chloroflexota bacterium]|nr:MFS transporter [Chloroflexota bacterium]
MNGLPLRNKALYAVGSLGANVIFQTMTMWLIYFYAPPPEAGAITYAPIALISLLMGIDMFVEAIDDPLIGYWSDSTRSRWGRRIPFIFWGIPPLILTYFFLWTPPIAGTSTWNGIYFIVMLWLQYLAGTIVMGSYEALLPEIAVTSSDRVSTSSWKVVMGTVGGAIGMMASSVLIERFDFRIMALVMSAIAFISYYVSLLGVKDIVRVEEPAGERLSLVEAVKATFTNSQFLFFIISLVLLYMGQSLLTGVIPYLVTVVVGETEDKVAILMGATMGVMLLSLPLMSKLTRIRSKKWAYALAMLALVFYLPLMYFVGFLPGIPKIVQGAVYAGLTGLPFCALYVFPNALLGDVIDYDELRTGERREAMYFGVFATISKVARALSTALFGFILGTFGYSGANPLGIRLMGPVAGLCVLVGWLIFRRYTLPDQVGRPVEGDRS